MLGAFRTLTDLLITQDRALCNARVAATELSRRRVEREDVELFLERLATPAVSPLAPAVHQARR